MTPLRIGITCYPTFGGSGIVASECGLELARRGHHVHFISYRLPVRVDPRLAALAEGVSFHEVEVPDYPLTNGKDGHGAYPLALASRMVEVSASERLDLLHVHYAVPHATSAWLAKQILLERGERAPRLVTTLHGTDITLVGSHPSFHPITRFSILQSDAVTTPSVFLRDATRARLDVPDAVAIEVIPNFVDTDLYRPATPADTPSARALFASDTSPGDLPILVHSSNFRPLKRVDEVVRIFAGVRVAMPALLLLIGDGPERPRIEALARELGVSASVCFLGEQLHFADRLRESDLFLLPSESESFGLAALEALSSGVPVIASRVGGVPEVVRDGVTGLLYEPGDTAAMTAAAIALLTDGERRTRMAHAARADALARFRIGPAVDRYEACYARVLDERTTSSTR